MYKDYKLIAFCISRINDARYLKVIKEINKNLQKYNYRLIVFQTCSDLFYDTEYEKGERAVFGLIDYNVIDAVAVYDEAIYDKKLIANIFARAKEHNIPAICVGGMRDDGISLKFEYAGGFEKVVRHVVEEHGIRDTHLIAGLRNNSYSEERIDAYKRVLKDNNIAFDDSMLSYGDFWSGPSREAVVKLIEEKRVPKAIICVNDATAVTVCATLHEYGYNVPDDVIVTGFDGIEAAKFCKPPLTTAKCAPDDIAKKFVEVLEDIFINKSNETVYKLEYKPVISSSCGCRNDVYNYNAADLVNAQTDVFYSYQESEHQLYSMLFEAITSKNKKELIESIDRYQLKDTVIMLNEENFDNSISPYEKKIEQTFSDNMICVHDSMIDTGKLPYYFNRENFLPHMDGMLESGRPVVITALNYIGIPIGYVCFYFEDTMDNYSKVLQYVTVINNTIGGYRNIRYFDYTAKTIENMYKYDLLTGLFNRQAFYNGLDELIEFKHDEDAHIILVSVDMDGLKNINDTYGHEEGDFAISKMAEAVKSIPIVNKVCARFGGDEMVACVISRDVEKDKKTVRTSIESFLDMVNATCNKDYKVCASIGISSCPLDGFDFNRLYKKSDELMYCEKHSKPNRRK